MVKAKIQASQLINRLQDHALKGREMTDSQRDSAKFLISYALPKPAQEHDVTANVVTEFRLKAGL